MGPYQQIKKFLSQAELRIDQMHRDFSLYYQGYVQRLPDWEGLERDLVRFSSRRMPEVELRIQLDRILYKFQNRKKIWLRWVQEIRGG